ncbi:energy-coupling factor transporter ATPase [Sporolactobacillus inulinus]|jgi:energy-coupling factor transport system ATP-binding protein|uniref:Cobalt transporter ATP-binding subunit n=2 Tax=Sporolactobacillus inulinus TaxID=2078 RepID=A0A0U1QRA5_9BACL|nr:energy-coupling factor transporter ATPase [Sporolactobacillus inulinus]KLI03272.1 cobalt transporter ATP-binding subunit [Sporolactobacillus inulinus CASD]GEB77598.1 energy-coupling factor transporter ATP-binding protein EcfA1 [Sporolactobacillus inulinus]
MSALIETQNLYFQYLHHQTKQKWILNGIDLSIHQGEFVAILGPNGCGKSTLAKHLNGLLLPSDGSVQIQGMDTADHQKLDAIRQTVGMVFQNPDNQLISTLVEEDVAFAPENLGMKPSEIQRRVDWALDAVDMLDYKRHSPFKLSGGQKQRIAIAGILAMRPQCIVMDEATSMLDPKGRADVMRIVKRLNHELGITILLITHHMDEAAEASRVLLMNQGKVVMDDRPEHVFYQIDLLKQLKLDVPQVVALVLRLRQQGIRLPDPIIHVEQCIDALTAVREEDYGTY